MANPSEMIASKPAATTASIRLKPPSPATRPARRQRLVDDDTALAVDGHGALARETEVVRDLERRVLEGEGTEQHGHPRNRGPHEHSGDGTRHENFYERIPGVAGCRPSR